jgi:stage IV sporulation protein B
MWLKDSTAGVGTVTYVIPETGEFAGLGHGICDIDTGKPLPLARGIVSGVNISGIKKGSPGSPGELRAGFMGGKVGILTDNRNTGVYGILSEHPDLVPIELGKREEICEGKAHIISTLDNSGAKEYEVELSAINKSSTGSKSFVVTVTDKALLEKTGGIVQGMSGSPIVQNGRLVGAVTQVFVNDPTRGYGIFIENMLSCK